MHAEYRCAEAGPALTLSSGGKEYEAKVTKGVSMEETHLPHRTHNGNEAPVVTWGKLDLGAIPLERGANELKLSVAGGNVEIKTLLLAV